MPIPHVSDSEIDHTSMRIIHTSHVSFNKAAFKELPGKSHKDKTIFLLLKFKLSRQEVADIMNIDVTVVRRVMRTMEL